MMASKCRYLIYLLCRSIHSTMFASLFPSLPPRVNRADQNPIVYEDGRSALHFRAAGSEYVFRNTIPPHGEEGASIMEPPFHFHTYQIENFRIVEGSVNLYMGLDPNPCKQLSSAPGADKTISIPNKVYHRFQNASSTERLVMDIQLSPENYEGEQRFFRNFMGYLDDCRIAKQAPSFFQLMVFLSSADTPLALPLPWHGLGVLVSRVFSLGIMAWGRWILGYKPSYPEYYQEKKTL